MSDTDERTGDATTAIRRRPPRWLLLAIAIFFGLFYAYDVWEAIGNLVGLNLLAQSLDTQLSAFGWAVLIFAVILPILVYALAYWLGRNRAFGVQALTLLVGLCAVAAVSLDLGAVFSLARLIV
ncbi:bacitracin resistance protein [Cryobacterium sp. PH31-L1]|uniref:bacitracin resistance protein n=1 Tax=Cryobacterium sp. PH31-L1 TaxID=3046199 RepID=UPI0024B9E609|nr:bacitracin resistance protein [Cryobacterium sp. PH31-L1]MDJ0378612.1 bacitracin resistance protein [Cryobacterium sp. PH31-L1]